MLQHLLRDPEIQECRKRTDEDIELGLGEDQLVKSTVGGKSSLKVGNKKWIQSCTLSCYTSSVLPDSVVKNPTLQTYHKQFVKRLHCLRLHIVAQLWIQ